MADAGTLFERVGGEAAVSELVDAFYGRVLGDSELRPFFADTDVDRLREMQKEFFAAALDGPMFHSDRDLAHIHQGRGIKRSHFSRFVKHLIAVLDDSKLISRADAMDIVFRISTYSNEITGEIGSGAG